jgi:hypothetical protein
MALGSFAVSHLYLSGVSPSVIPITSFASLSHGVCASTVAPKSNPAASSVHHAARDGLLAMLAGVPVGDIARPPITGRSKYARSSYRSDQLEREASRLDLDRRRGFGMRIGTTSLAAGYRDWNMIATQPRNPATRRRMPRRQLERYAHRDKCFDLPPRSRDQGLDASSLMYAMKRMATSELERRKIARDSSDVSGRYDTRHGAVRVR